MYMYNFIFALIICAALFYRSEAQQIPCDLAVIGGGAGGANAAMFYKQKFPSRSVCLLEKEAQLGGHCQTVPNPSGFGWTELGVIVIINTSQANAFGYGNFTLRTDQYLTSLGLGLYPVDFTSLPDLQLVVNIAKRTGLNYSAPSDPDFPIRFGTALATFMTMLRTQYPWVGTSSWPATIPQELLGNFEAWLGNNTQYEPLIPAFNGLLTLSGLGPWNQLTTVYAFQALDPALLGLFFPGQQLGMGIFGGCSSLYKIIDANLSSGVYYNMTNINVNNRPSGNSNSNANYPVTITGTTRTASGQTMSLSFKAKHLIVAIPQTAGNAQLIGFNPDNLESLAFIQVQTRNYYTTLATFTGPLVAGKSVTLNNFDTNPYGQPTYPTTLNCFATFPNIPGSCKGYSVAYVDPDVFANTTIQPSLVNISNAPFLNPGNFSVTTLGPTYLHVYQPHFNASALAASPHPYTRISNLQGYRNTYYVGALMTYANHARIMDHALRIVNMIP